MPCPALLLTFDALHEAAVLLDFDGNVLHGNRAADQLFGWNVKPSAVSAAAAAAASASTHVVASMLSLSPTPVDHPGHAHAAENGDEVFHKARQRSRSVASSTSASGTDRLPPAPAPAAPPRASPPISRGRPNLTFNPETQQASWADILASLPDGEICQRDGVGYRLEPASGDRHAETPTRTSFPVSVHLLRMSDGAYAVPAASRSSADEAPELHESDPHVDGGDPYVCVFVRELPHAADQWSRQHRAMSANYDDAEVAMEAMAVSDNGYSGSDDGRGPSSTTSGGEVGGAGPVPVGGGVLDPIDLEQKQMLTASATAIIEASIDPMFCINERCIIMMVNEAAVRAFGYSRQEFIGANIQMIVGGGHAKVRVGCLKRKLWFDPLRVGRQGGKLFGIIRQILDMCDTLHVVAGSSRCALFCLV